MEPGGPIKIISVYSDLLIDLTYITIPQNLPQTDGKMVLNYVPNIFKPHASLSPPLTPPECSINIYASDSQWLASALFF